MYQFSRSIYRALAPEIIADRDGGSGNHERVLHACESAVRRLATDRHYFARPSRTLFNDVRIYFPMGAQHRVYQVVDSHLRCAREWLDAQPHHGVDEMGHRLECRATTRKGKPCQRVPLPENGYCPSHQHLADPPAEVLAAA